MRDKQFVSQAIEICCNPKKVGGQISYRGRCAFKVKERRHLETAFAQQRSPRRPLRAKLFITIPVMFPDVIWCEELSPTNDSREYNARLYVHVSAWRDTRVGRSVSGKFAFAS